MRGEFATFDVENLFARRHNNVVWADPVGESVETRVPDS